MKLGVVGLPNVGKSTLFNALTKAQAAAANYPFCTIEPNTGIVPVPDKRLDRLAEIYHPKKYTPATIEFVDIAGLVRGASRGEGLGNKFLSHIREVDAIVHVVRCFEDENIVHVEGRVDPARDVHIVNIELILADIEAVEKRMARARKALKGDSAAAAVEISAAEKLLAHMSAERPARTAQISKQEREAADQWFLLTNKPVIYAANISENDISKPYDENIYLGRLKALAEADASGMLVISAKIEEEIAQLEQDEKDAFLAEIGLKESGLDRLIVESYRLLGLMSFLTVGEDEVRAWTIPIGCRAPQAAGKIHTDFERGFIRAEIVDFTNLSQLGSMAACRERGLVRSEGKEYIMRDGDVVLFRFNV